MAGCRTAGPVSSMPPPSGDHAVSHQFDECRSRRSGDKEMNRASARRPYVPPRSRALAQIEAAQFPHRSTGRGTGHNACQGRPSGLDHARPRWAVRGPTDTEPVVALSGDYDFSHESRSWRWWRSSAAVHTSWLTIATGA